MTETRLAKDPMRARRLGTTELRVSEVTLGTWGLTSGAYGPVSKARVDATIRAALEAGVRSFDLAPLWGDGEAERRVGEIVREEKADVVLMTRGGARYVDGKLVRSFDKESLIADCEGSLERLGVDEIDLWMLHNPGARELEDDGWIEAIEALEEQGKIRAWGVSVGEPEEARVALEGGADAICVTHHLLNSELLDELEADLEVNGAAVLARSPLAHGLLSGEWSATRTFPERDHRSRRWSPLALDERVRQVDGLRFLVGDEIPDMATAAIRYTLSHHFVTSAIVGARSPLQIKAAVDSAGKPPYLGREAIVKLAAERKRLRV